MNQKNGFALTFAEIVNHTSGNIAFLRVTNSFILLKIRGYYNPINIV